MERHIVTIISAAILGILVWVGNELTGSIATTAKTDVRLGNIESDIKELKVEMVARMQDRYTGEQARQRNRHVDRQLMDIKTWKEQAERRLDALEIKNGAK